MAKIGQINTVITSNAAPLISGLNQAAAAVTSFKSKIAGMAGAVAPLLGSFAAVTAAIRGVMVVSNEFGEIDAIAKYARATGQTVNEVVGLRHAAGLTGVEIGVLEAAQKKALRQGLSLSQIADEVAAIADPAEQARLAFDRLGKQGQELVPFLSQGGDAIRDMVAEGAELSGFNMADAMKIEEANDAWARMQAIFVGITRDFAISLAPGIEFVSKKVQQFGMLARQAFSAITPMIVQFTNVASSAFNTVQSVVESVFGRIVNTGVSALTSIRDFLLDAMIVAEFTFTNIGSIASLAWQTTQLGLMQLWGEVKHTFTERIPKTLTWFAENWRDIFFTAVDYSLTVLINLGDNIRKVWSGVLDFIAGRGFNVDFTPLSEGFVNTIKKLPDIGEREISATEAALAQSVASLGKQLDSDLGDLMNRRREELFGDGGVIETRAVLGLDDEDIGEKIANKIGELTGPQALQRGTAEAFSAIFAAMRGDSLQDKMLETANAGLKESRKQTRTLEQIANRPQELAVAEL